MTTKSIILSILLILAIFLMLANIIMAIIKRKIIFFSGAQTTTYDWNVKEDQKMFVIILVVQTLLFLAFVIYPIIKFM
jgi:hypothetical protein